VDIWTVQFVWKHVFRTHNLVIFGVKVCLNKSYARALHVWFRVDKDRAHESKYFTSLLMSSNTH